MAMVMFPAHMILSSTGRVLSLSAGYTMRAQSRILLQSTAGTFEFLSICILVLYCCSWGTPTVGDYTTGGDRYTPGELLRYKWESCFTIQKSSWGYDRVDSDLFYNTSSLIKQLVSTVSRNGYVNLLDNNCFKILFCVQ